MFKLRALHMCQYSCLYSRRFSLSVLLVFELLWVHEPPLLALVPSVRVIEQVRELTMPLCSVSLSVWFRFIFQPAGQGSRNSLQTPMEFILLCPG